jgi:hypothetical protein
MTPDTPRLPICWRCSMPIQTGTEVVVGIGRVAHAECERKATLSPQPTISNHAQT